MCQESDCFRSNDTMRSESGCIWNVSGQMKQCVRIQALSDFGLFPTKCDENYVKGKALSGFALC
jgi:hypothetical protein